MKKEHYELIIEMLATKVNKLQETECILRRELETITLEDLKDE